MKKNNLALPCCKEKQFALLSGTISKHRSMSDYFRKINGNEKKKIEDTFHFSNNFNQFYFAVRK